MNIIAVAFDMAKAVESFVEKAKKFFYSVMLLGHRCPKCNGSLTIVPKGRCKCTSCGNQFDPTIEFQRCSACGGVPVLKVRQYECRKCHGGIRSKFLFDGLIFSAEYFRQKVAESRERKKEQKERVKQMLAESRSDDLSLAAVDLTSSLGLLDALNNLTTGMDADLEIESRDEFDLKRYETHIKAHIQNFPLSLGEIPPLSRESARKDLIWRFIAVIFLAHAGIVDIWQDGQDIMVIKHETNRKRCDVPGELEEADGIERSLGGVET
ncbi:hypothetical protein ACFL5F_06710 [Planctomycetota bacterium]